MRLAPHKAALAAACLATAYLAPAVTWAWIAWPASAQRPIAWRLAATVRVAVLWPLLANQVRGVVAERHPPSPTGDQAP